MKRYFHQIYGWGDIIAEDEQFITVRFDSDPWYPIEIEIPLEKDEDEGL